jgi:hypothetical protein
VKYLIDWLKADQFYSSMFAGYPSLRWVACSQMTMLGRSTW